MLLPEAREVFRNAGAEVDEETELVRFAPELVAQSLALAPLVVRARRARARAHRHARRAPPRHGPGQQPARRQRPRRRQALGQPRRLPRPRPADAALRRDARHRPVRRAAGRAGPVPPPAVQPRVSDADRQGAVPLRARARPGAGQLRDVPDRLRPRRGGVPLHPVLLHGDQQQLAAAARHPDVHGPDRLRRRRAGGGDHAVHAGRRDGAGDARRRAHASARRGARRDRADAGGAARSAGRLRGLHLERGHEVGRPRLRDSGVLQGGARERPARASRRAALPLVGARMPRTPSTRRRCTRR